MKNKLYALIIGIDDYKTCPLSGCVNDAKRIESYINSPIVTNQYNTEVLCLHNEVAKRTSIISTIESHLGQAEEGDVAFLYFSGHGAQELADTQLWHEESDKKLEGLVCHDSLETDILLADKELRFLIHQLAQNNPHIVTVFDCCHSGENTRGIKEEEIVFTKRQLVYSKMSAAFPKRRWEDFCFNRDIDQTILTTKTFNEVIPQGNHIQLAACQSDESAYETYLNNWGKGGVFTYTLLQVLERSKGQVSYYDLKSRIQLYIKNQFNQRPTIYVRGNDSGEIYKQFLGKEKGSQPMYGNVVYNSTSSVWMMDLGAMHGISKKVNEVSIVDSLGGTYTGYVNKVNSTDTSLIIDQNLDKKESYQAYLKTYKSAPISIYINGDKYAKEAKYKLVELIELKGTNINLAQEEKLADYVVQLDKWNYTITLVNDPYRPLVLPQRTDSKDAAYNVFKELHHISEWEFVKQLHNTDAESRLNANAIKIEFFDALSNEAIVIDNDQVDVNINKDESKNEIKIKLTNTSGQRLHVAALYLGVNFNVHPKLLETTVQLLEPNGETWLTVGNSDNSIRYFLDEWKRLFNWKKSTLFFKFIISTQEFDVINLELKGLPSPAKLLISNRGKKSIIFDENNEKSANGERWTTRQIEFNIQNANCNKIYLEDLERYMQTDAAPYLNGLYFKNTDGFSNDAVFKDDIIVIDNRDIEEKGVKEVVVNIANWVSRTLRHRRYKKRLEEFPDSIKVVSEGDSWFQYPHPKVLDIIDHLSNHCAIRSVGAAGDEVINYYKEQEYLKAVRREQPDFFLISGGGNDILGPEFEGFLRDDLRDDLKIESKDDLVSFMNAAFFTKLDKVIETYQKIYDSIFKEFPDLQILIHGYDYIIPLDQTNKGWLGRYMIKKNMTIQENRRKLIKYLLVEFNDRMETLANQYDHVHYIDVRESVKDDRWYDEIHPDSEGFEIVANKFLDKIKELQPFSVNPEKGKSENPLPVNTKSLMTEPINPKEVYEYDQLINDLEAKQALEKGVSSRSIPQARGMQDLQNQFVVFSVPEDKTKGGILDLGDAIPSKKGSNELPDALVRLEMLGFNIGTEENIKPNTTATMRLVVGQQDALDNQLEPLFWVIQAGLNLFNKEEGRPAGFKELSTDLDKAFNKRYIEIPNGVGYLTFDVVKHETPKWWQKVFKFLGSGVGQNLISVIGLPAITNTALNAVRGLFNEIKENNAKPLFKSRGLKLALTQFGKDKITGGSSTLRVGTLNEGIFIMIRGRDYEFFKKIPAKYDMTHNMLVPHTYTPDDYFKTGKPNPFDNKTFALFRIRTKEVNLKENYLYFS